MYTSNLFDEIQSWRNRLVTEMGKKKTEEAGTAMKTPSSKEASKDGKKEQVLSVSAMLASMDQKPNKPKKASSSSTTSGKPKSKAAQKLPSYTDESCQEIRESGSTGEGQGSGKVCGKGII